MFLHRVAGLSRPQTPPSHEEKQSGEPSQISWVSAHFATVSPSNVQNTLCQTCSNEGMNTRVKENFTVVREVLCNNY